MTSQEHYGSRSNSTLNRKFCNKCSNIILVDPSISSMCVMCPICQANLTKQPDHHISSSANSSLPLNFDVARFIFPPLSARFFICRNAIFEHRNPTDNFIRVVSDYGFFNPMYPNSQSVIIPIVHVGTIFSIPKVGRHLVDCVNEGAKINSNINQHQILELLENFDNIKDLQDVLKFVIASLPKVKITEDHIACKGTECSICAEDFNIGEEVKQLPCQHLYHKDCIERWLKKKISCPLCRCELKIPKLNYNRLRAAWIPLSATRGQNAMQQSSIFGVKTFQLELLWPVQRMSSLF